MTSSFERAWRDLGTNILLDGVSAALCPTEEVAPGGLLVQITHLRVFWSADMDYNHNMSKTLACPPQASINREEKRLHKQKPLEILEAATDAEKRNKNHNPARLVRLLLDHHSHPCCPNSREQTKKARPQASTASPLCACADSFVAERALPSSNVDTR